MVFRTVWAVPMARAARVGRPARAGRRKRAGWPAWVAWTVCLAPLAGSLPEPALAERTAVGAFIGYHNPWDQDDASDDMLLGAKARFPFLSTISLQGDFTYYKMGIEPFNMRGVAQEVRSWTITRAGLMAIYGRGFGETGTHPYLALGAGYYFLRKDETPETNCLGLRGAIGFDLLMKEDIAFDLCVGVDRIQVKNGGARALASARAGLNYFFGTL